MPHLGIAVATTLGGWLNAGLLYVTLVKRGIFVPDERLRRALKLIVVASLAMGVAVWGMATALQEWFAAPSWSCASSGLGLLVTAGLAVYGAAILISGAVEVRQLRALLRRRPSAIIR